MNAVFSIKHIECLQYVTKKLHDIIKVAKIKLNCKLLRRVTEKFKIFSIHASDQKFSELFTHYKNATISRNGTLVNVENSAIALSQIYHQPLNQRDFFYGPCKKSAVQEILISTVRLWDPDVKIFGSGTELIVSKKESSPPANSEILQKKHENQTTYVCLIEKFYPEVIRVTWTDDEKEVTDNAVKGDTWQTAKDDEYSIASWLTVPAENKDKKYYCKYEHEKKQASLSTQDAVKTASQEKDCGTVFNRDQLMHRTAYLVYIILLLKSSMYYLILLFFIYKMWASNQHQGKKA